MTPNGGKRQECEVKAMKRMNRVLALCLALVLAVGLLPITAGAVELSDIDGSWAKEVILAGVEAGYINGYGDGTFRPNEPVTRAQFAKMLNNAIGAKNAAAVSFADVTAGAWYYDEVRKAVSAQYIAGYNDNTFRPDRTITRQEAAVMLSRLVTEPTEKKSSGDFADSAAIDAWARDSVDLVYAKGYMKGDNHNDFDPKGNLTRAQAAQLIYSLTKGETIVADGTTVMDDREGVLFVNDVMVSSLNDVTLRRCRVLGTLNVGADVTLDGTKANRMSVVGEDVEITASGTAQIKETTARAAVELTEKNLTGDGFQNVALTGDLSAATVKLTGSFDQVTLESGTVLSHTGGKIALMDLNKKAALTIQRGDIDRFHVAAAAADSTVVLSSDVTVGTATMDGAASFRGAGTINTAVENVVGCSYETAPGSIVGSHAGESGDEWEYTVVPAQGASNVAVDTAVTLVLPENAYNLSGSGLTGAYMKSEVLTLTTGSAPVDFTATVSGRTVTIRPTVTLEYGKTYTLRVAAEKMQNGTGKKNTAFSASFTTVSATASSMTPTFTPARGENTVSTLPEITVSFDSVLFNASGNTLTGSYVEGNVAEIRTGSETGTLVSFTATIGADRKSILLKPDAALGMNTTYYVLLKARTLRNSENVYNGAASSYFTTGEQSAFQPTSVSPANARTNVSKSTTIVLNFSEPVYRSRGVTVTANYVRDNVVELHKDTASGETVAFGVTIGSNNRTFTLTPNVVLANDTTYYVVVNKDTLVTADGSPNGSFVSRFSTGRTVETELEFLPEDGATNVSTSGGISITFPAAVVRSGYDTLKTSYVESTAVQLRRGSTSGTTVEFTAEISNSGKTITIYPVSDLELRTRYYVTVVKDTLTYADGTDVGSASASFTTADTNPVAITLGEVAGGAMTVSVKTGAAGTLTVSYRNGSKNVTLVSGVGMAAGASREFDLTGLVAGSGSVTATLNYNGTNYTRTESFTVAAGSTTAKLEEITLLSGSDTYPILVKDGTGTTFNVTPTAATGASLRMKPVEAAVTSVQYAINSNTTSAYQALTAGADGYYVLSGLDFTAGQTTTVYVRVTAGDGKTTQNYTIRITCNY